MKNYFDRFLPTMMTKCGVKNASPLLYLPFLRKRVRFKINSISTKGNFSVQSGRTVQQKRLPS